MPQTPFIEGLVVGKKDVLVITVPEDMPEPVIETLMDTLLDLGLDGRVIVIAMEAEMAVVRG